MDKHDAVQRLHCGSIWRIKKTLRTIAEKTKKESNRELFDLEYSKIRGSTVQSLTTLKNAGFSSQRVPACATRVVSNHNLMNDFSICK
jgi:hypothetical protein